METVGRLVALLAGVWLVVWVEYSAIRQVILPRGEPVTLTRFVWVPLRTLFNLRVKRLDSFEARDRALALFSPIGLVLMAASWMVLVLVGFTAINWALGVDPLQHAFELSGSSLLTLGFHDPPNLPTHLAAFAEGGLGLTLIALLISYLPSIYSAFQRRESVVAELATRAGDPPEARINIERYANLHGLSALDDKWNGWESWFEDIEETHTSQPSLVFFRSIGHDRSWVTTAGVILDTASLRASTLDLPRNPRAELCIRAGFISLRRIADFFGLPYDPDPRPDDPISIDRSEFDAVYDSFLAVGVPVKPDRDQCWKDYAGWRVNYDEVLLGLAGIISAPYAPWSSDRSLPFRRSPVFSFGFRRNGSGPGNERSNARSQGQNRAR